MNNNTNALGYVRQHLLQIQNELSKKEYCLSSEQINTLKKRSDNCDIIFTDIGGSGFKSLLPNYSDGKLVQQPNVLKLRRFVNVDVFSSVSCHEISHLLSNGEWELRRERSRVVARRISGIDRETCTFANENRYFFSDNLANINELINDWIAKKIHVEINHTSYISNKRYELIEFEHFIQNSVVLNLDNDYKKLIGFYFANDLDSMEASLLTGTKFEDLKMLETYFAKIIWDRDELEK